MFLNTYSFSVTFFSLCPSPFFILLQIKENEQKKFLHTHREASILPGELPEESEHFRFLRSSRLVDLKDSVGLILVKDSTMWVTIPIDLSTRSFIPLPRFLTLVKCLLFLINLWS